MMNGNKIFPYEAMKTVDRTELYYNGNNFPWENPVEGDHSCGWQEQM